MMRRTGKLYTLTLVSSSLTVFASTLVCLWGPDTSAFHLWLDLFPQGFGMASFITSTLIVSIDHHSGETLETSKQAMIAGVYREDMAAATGSKSTNGQISMRYH